MPIQLRRVATATRGSLLQIGLVLAFAGCSNGTAAPASTASLAAGGPSGVVSPSPTSSVRALDKGVQGPLDEGTYVTASPFLTRVTFSLPRQWFADVGGPYAVFLDPTVDPVSNDDGLVEFLIFDKVYADPCHVNHGLLNPSPGPSVDDLANALAKVPGLVATTPTDVTVAGYHGKQLTLTSSTGTAACSIWQLPLGAANVMVPGEVDRYWILDVNGQRLVISAHEVPRESAAHKAEVQTILDSIGIAPAT
jgi:hypothetical protein